jgi:hypothetical protein
MNTAQAKAIRAIIMTIGKFSKVNMSFMGNPTGGPMELIRKF